MKETLSKNLKRIMNEKNMTVTELEEISHVSYKQIVSYRTGKTYPTDYNILRLANALNVDYHDLVGIYDSDSLVRTKKLIKQAPLEHTFNQSIIKYGKEPQCRQAMEELAELIQAINKCIRYPDRKDCHDNLIEEICDVEIMLYQLKVMFNVSDNEVFEMKVQKAKREQERLKKL